MLILDCFFVKYRIERHAANLKLALSFRLQISMKRNILLNLHR